MSGVAMHMLVVTKPTTRCYSLSPL
jgi:hypothetical protein